MEALPALPRDGFEDEIPRNIKCHLNIIKWVGVLLILSTCTVPGIVMITTAHYPTPADSIVTPDVNQTDCIYVKQYHLQHNTYATVCNMNGHILVDLRRYINGTATVIGMQLELNQWLTLKQTIPSIDKAIEEARAYWKTLKSL